MRLAPGACLAVAALLLAGCAGAPSGPATFVPAIPPGWSVRLVPLGDFPAGRLIELTGFYNERYGLSSGVLSPAPIDAAVDPTRGQFVGEALISSIRRAYPLQASEPQAVLIGVTSEDLYISSRPEWAWAFAIRQDGHLAVISTARMRGIGPFSGPTEATRLRKMVTKYIGLLYFGLKESADPRSVLYGSILGVADLDRMGEEF